MGISTSTNKNFLPHSILAAITLGTACGLQAPAQAFTVYFGEDLGLGETTRLSATPNSNAARDQFLSRLVGVGTETFESFANNQKGPLAINFGSSGVATLTGDGLISNVSSGTNERGRYPISGTKYWEASSQFAINFSNPVAAFGFYGTDIGDFDGQVTLNLLNTLTGFNQTLTIANTISGTGGSALFYGLIAGSGESFNRVVFGNTAAGTDYFGFDNMTIGSEQQVLPPGEAVPEPATILGSTMALGALAAARRKRQQKNIVADNSDN
jgi:hypothetical protein